MHIHVANILIQRVVRNMIILYVSSSSCMIEVVCSRARSTATNWVPQFSRLPPPPPPTHTPPFPPPTPPPPLPRRAPQHLLAQYLYLKVRLQILVGAT